jgi:hypothetical protein
MFQRTVATSDLESRGVRALGPDFFSTRPTWLKGNISEYDARFLAGLAHFSNPRRVVEIGVASGWSSVVLLKALSTLEGDRKVTGIDLSPSFYLDNSIPTGQAVQEAVPELKPNYNLITGRFAMDVMPEVGKVDFAFIDGNHMHPWATLDALSVLPFMDRGCWIALHDLNLCTRERHRHQNRGPFYLFYMWPDNKLHSTQTPTMIGAIALDRPPVEYLSTLLEVLYTPWEVDVNATELSKLTALIKAHFGDEWSGKFSEAFTHCKERFKPVPVAESAKKTQVISPDKVACALK